jgi:hypothetical protein
MPVSELSGNAPEILRLKTPPYCFVKAHPPSDIIKIPAYQVPEPEFQLSRITGRQKSTLIT